MASREKKAVRRRFRAMVFARDGYRCVRCGVAGYDRQSGFGEGVPLDAHHVVDRHLMPDGGYTLGNGLTLCGPCHEREEDC